MTEPLHAEHSELEPSLGRRKIARLLALIVIVLAVIIGWRYVVYLEHNQSSEDAIIQANVVHVGALVPGKLKTLAITDGQRVKKGDLIMQIDPSTYELRVRQAKAELALAQAALNDKLRLIEAESANANIANEQVARAQSNLALTLATLKRLEALAPKGYVTAQQVDDAKTLHKDAQISLTQAIAQAQAAQALVGQTEAVQAAIEVARVSVALAEKALADTTVTAPHDGLVVGLSVATGELLAPEQALFTLIDTSSWYATALFRETELPALQIGDCAIVYTLAAPKTAMSGRIESIGWGVTSEELLKLPRSLPFVQKSLNWVRVAQRFPVRILITDPDPNLMRIGASASVIVRDNNPC